MPDLKFSILLADDDAQQRDLLARAMVDCEPSLKITTAASGEELFQSLSRDSYDCLVLDCNMPPLGPMDIIGAPQVRASGCSVVAVSSCDEQSVVIESLRGGAVDFIPKAIAIQGTELWSRVRKAIERKCAQARERRCVEARQQQLESLAQTDPLTGLLNRRSFERRISENRRHDDGAPLACIMLDIDHFKAINDQFGHAAGDVVLSTVGSFIASQIRPGDTAFRWGGEEFLILRPNVGLSEAHTWADGLRRRLAMLRIAINDTAPPLSITSSMGIETVLAGEFEQAVIDRADQAMYLAKHSGRNQVCTWPMVLAGEQKMEMPTLSLSNLSHIQEGMKYESEFAR